MADFPSYVYQRRPIEDADLVEGGGLNAAIDRLQGHRDEVVAIETALGKSLKGAAPSLAQRLGVRLSRNGIPRGQLYFSTAGLWYDGTLWLQVGQTTIAAGQPSFGFQAFTKNYVTANVPSLVVTQAQANSVANPCAWVPCGHILATGFFYSLAQRSRAYNGSNNLVDAITFNWLVIGGTPA